MEKNRALGGASARFLQRLEPAGSEGRHHSGGLRKLDACVKTPTRAVVSIHAELRDGARDRANDLVLSAAFSGIRIAYLATNGESGVINEIFSGTSIGSFATSRAAWWSTTRDR
jgi:hypothetical protein